MANTQDFTNFFKDIPSAFPVDADAATKALKTWTGYSERFSGIALDAAGKSTEIAAGAARDVITLLRDVSKTQGEPSDYAAAVSTFGSAQAELIAKNFEAFGDVAKQAQNDTVELLMAAGKQVSEDSASAVKTAAAPAPAKKAAKAA